MEVETNYVVAGSKAWNRRVFEEVIAGYPNAWHFVGHPSDLTVGKLSSLAPRYVFFLHWSWKVPSEIVKKYECVCFHMTDLPYGRGGSPLQNLIALGRRETKLTALRMVEGFDAGPVYLKESLSLEGNAEEIYIRSTYLAAKMIRRIMTDNIEPVPQFGEVVVFKRRKPLESRIPELPSLDALHDFIRMLDAEGYPRAFLEHQGFRYEFSRAAIYHGRIVADVVMTPIREVAK